MKNEKHEMVLRGAVAVNNGLPVAVSAHLNASI